MTFLGMETEEQEHEYLVWLKNLGISASGAEAEFHSIFYNIVDDITKARECTEKCLGATEKQYEGIIELMRNGANVETAYKAICLK